MIRLLTESDNQILLWLQNNFRNEFLTPIFVFVTRLGDMGAVWICVSAALLCFKKTRLAGAAALCSLGITFVINDVILKNVIARVRPYDAMQGLARLIEEQSGYSFPSGHTASSFAAAVVMFCLLPKKYGVPALVLAFLIGFSRMYLGVHYFTDVLAGALIGAAVAVAVSKAAPKAAAELRRHRP